MTETDAETPAAPASVSRWRMKLPRVDWKAKARWFAAEYLIVVLGVLTAVALNAWWGERADRADELTLLRQMYVTLGQDSTLYAQMAAEEQRWSAEASSIARDLDAGVGSMDTLALYNLSSLALVPIRLAPYETLKARGLGLILSDSLRSAITSFYEWQTLQVANHNEWLKIAETRWMPLLLRRLRHGETAAVPRDAAALLTDEEFRLFLDERLFYLRYTRPWKLSMAAQAGDLLQAVRREIRTRE